MILERNDTGKFVISKEEKERMRASAMKFELDDVELEKLYEFQRQQYAKLVELQKGTAAEMWHSTDENGITYPHLGSIGGGFTYEFTPTSIGTSVKVTFCKGHPTYEATIDLTDYASW